MAVRKNLETLLQSWSKAPSVSIPPWDDFIQLAYDRVSREVRPADLDEVVTLDTSAATNVRGAVWSHKRPTGMLEALSLTNNGQRLRVLRSDALQERAIDQSINRPAWHCVVGDAIWVGPGVGGDLRLVYNERDTIILQDADTNFGLNNYLDAYLAAGLVAYYQWAEDQENEERALARYDQVKMRVNEEAHRVRRGAGIGAVS